MWVSEQYRQYFYLLLTTLHLSQKSPQRKKGVQIPGAFKLQRQQVFYDSCNTQVHDKNYSLYYRTRKVQHVTEKRRGITCILAILDFEIIHPHDFLFPSQFDQQYQHDSNCSHSQHGCHCSVATLVTDTLIPQVRRFFMRGIIDRKLQYTNLGSISI